MKTIRLAIARGTIALASIALPWGVLFAQLPPSLVGGGDAALSSPAAVERTLAGTIWEVDMERGQRAWGDIRFREGREFTTMNGPNGAWKVTGGGKVELGSMYVVEFARGLESFVVSRKEGGAKVATGKLRKVRTGLPPAAPQSTTLAKPAPAPAAVQAPKGIPVGARPFRGKWYVVYHEVLAWDEAKERCTTFGGQLAVVPDEATWKFILSLQDDKQTIWMGATDVVSKGDWKWIDGTPFTFSRWFNRDTRANHADNETYLSIDNYWPGSPWRALPKDGNMGRTHARGFICEWKDVPIPLATVLAKSAVAPAAPAGTIPDPLGLNRPGVVPDKPLGITLPPLPGAAPPSPKAATPLALIPASISGRFGAGRAKAMMQNKMKPTTELAVLKGLLWLKQSQNADGSWGDVNKGAMSGFALLSFLGHGETAESVEFGPTVKKGVDWLVRMGTAADGRFATLNQSGVYEHGIATYALGEYYVMSGDVAVVPLLRQAIGYIVNGQGNGGGWMYSYDKSADDLSVSGWQVQALKAAHLSRLNLPGVDQALDKAVACMDRMKGPKGGYGYRSVGDKYSLTGVGVLCQLLWKGERGILRKGMEWVLEETENTSPVKYDGAKADLYAWYYHTQACFMFGGTAWIRWNRWFQDEITRAQVADGSWPIPGGKGIGPQSASNKSAAVYRTALCTLMLETFYRNLPTAGYVPNPAGAQPPATPLRILLPPTIQRNPPGTR